MTTNYVVAPREPTQEMLDANGVCPGYPEGKAWLEKDAKETWALMLAAIPDDPDAPVLVERAELEALRRDAERYRWLRNGQSVQIFEVHEKWTSSHRLDAVIDAAKERGT